MGHEIMANSDIIDLIVASATNMFDYMMPIIGLMAGLVFITSFLLYITVGVSRKIFRD